jgi:tRNA modification GTPase
MQKLDDTIAAIATAAGEAGIAVVRLSGADALAIADRVFRGTTPLARARGHTLHTGWVVWPSDRGLEPHDPAGAHELRDARRDEVPGSSRSATTTGRATTPPDSSRIDQVVAAVFRAPRSYTREDVVEISCHGGGLSAARVLATLRCAGARLARPGEFTLRAFLNGRIDLAQAEAVADVIHAESEAARLLAVSQLAGDLSRRLSEVEERLTDALSEVEARVDFAEDVGGIEVPAHVVAAIVAVEERLAAMLAGSAFARAIREGVRLPLVGRPNVGKSSLFNALLGEERAIVTPIPGTTRDRVSEAIEVGGVRFTLSDTAGLRASSEPVEAIGVARAEEAIQESPLVLWVIDGSERLTDEDRRIAGLLAGKRIVIALNKRDLGSRVSAVEVESLVNGDSRRRAVEISAASRQGLEDLERSLLELLGRDGAAPLAGAVANPRHVDSLEGARAALVRAVAVAADGAPGEIIALELRESLAAIGEVTGRTVAEDLLDRIFGRFCIGK